MKLIILKLLTDGEEQLADELVGASHAVIVLDDPMTQLLDDRVSLAKALSANVHELQALSFNVPALMLVPQELADDIIGPGDDPDSAIIEVSHAHMVEIRQADADGDANLQSCEMKVQYRPGVPIIRLYMTTKHGSLYTPCFPSLFLHSPQAGKRS